MRTNIPLVVTHPARHVRTLKITVFILATLFFASEIFAAPVITSFAPATGPVGISVVLSGSGFNATASQNAVFFGATKATVTAASISSLTVTVPAGSTYEKITVTNLAAAQTGYSAKPFIVTLNGGFIFKPKQDITAGAGPVFNLNADLDGDGKPDVIVINQNSNSVSVMRNISVPGTGSFAAKQDFTTPSNPTGVAIGDVDGDGKPDMVVSTFTSQKISVFRNTSTPGTISFAASVDFISGFGYSVSIADFDGDGKSDVAVADENAGAALVFRNTSPGAGSVSFAAKLTFTSGTSPFCIASGDIDGDGKADLVTANSASNNISILRNTSTLGNITFAPKTDVSSGNNPESCAIGDFDGDGKPDVATANYAVNTVSIIRNTSSAGFVSFAVKTDFPAAGSPRGLGIGDINGDGKADLAIATNNLTVITYKNISAPGTVTLIEPITTPTGGNSKSVAIGDLDGDSKPDLSVANFNSGNLSFIQQENIPPTITSISPTSGAVGSSVVISGTNFSLTPAQNVVNFGATKATVTAATATSLTATVPLGSTYQLLSVTNLSSGLTAFSDKAFNVTLAGSTAFKPKQDLPVSANPNSVVIGDLDGDGKPDLAMVNSSATPVTVIRNTSAGGVVSFAPKQDFGTGTTINSVTIGDLNGDGKPDLAVTSQGSHTVEIYRNTSVPGTISFASPIGFYAQNFPNSVAIDDIDGDGKPDLAVACGLNLVVILRNLSAGSTISFATEIEFTTPDYSEEVSLGDIDGDGKPDLAVTNYASGNMSILRNTSFPGSILFAAKVDFATSPNPGKLVIADIDGDGKLDVSVAGRDNNVISILRNTSTPGTLSLAAKIDIATPNYPRSISIGDVDGDGKPDLAVANYNSNSVSLLRNTSTSGTVSFAARLDFTATLNPESVAIGDIDGDGKPDMSAVSNSGTLSIFQQGVIGGLLTISGISPTSGPVGSSVVISGTNFSTSPSQNVVYFGATKATVTAASTNSLTVTVPLGSTYQFISATNLATNLTAFSDRAFNVTLAGSTNFNPKQDFPVELGASSLTLSDLDGDGKPDLAMVINNGTTVTVIRNTSAGGVVSFAPKQDYGTGPDVQSVSIGDLDGDGKPDLAVASRNSFKVDIFRNTSTPGSISFASPVSFLISGFPKHIAIDDIDGDGKPDLAVACGSNYVMIMRNQSTPGTMSFSAAIQFPTPDYSDGVSLGDIDGDGKPDLAVTNYNSSSFSLLRNTSVPGNIAFAAKVDFATGSNPENVLIADIDGDGKSDVTVSSSGTYLLSVFRNTSSPGVLSLAARLDIAIPSYPRSIGIGDVDGDGKPDLATPNYYSYSASLLKNTSVPGSISFAPRTDLTLTLNPESVAIGDIDGDGRPDLSVLTFRQIFSVFQQIAPVPPPTGNAAQSFCASLSAKVSNLVATGSNIKWYSAGNVLLAATTPLANATTYYASQTVNGAESAQRLAVTVTIDSTGPEAGPLLSAICPGTATPALGGSITGTATSAIWSDNNAGGTFTNNTGTTPATTIYTAAANATGTITLKLTTTTGTCPGFDSKTVYINTAATWLGLTNNWNSPTNWSSGSLPAACTDVIVNAGAGIIMPTVTGLSSVCKKLTLNNGAVVTIAVGAKLLVTGTN
ncbi:MAG: FG-GAP-like repeat-containing protein [Chitinophagaceae bacterium]